MPTSAPDSTAPRKADAVLIPKNYPPGLVGGERGRELNRRFGPVLGSRRVAVTSWMGGEPDQTFVRPEGKVGDETLQKFHKEGPLAGRERYEWFVAEEKGGVFTPVAPVLGLPGDATKVRLGYALDEDLLIAEEIAEAADPEYEAALQKAMADPATRTRMARAGLLPGEAPKDVARADVAAARAAGAAKKEGA
jgi:hypothetical protein